MKSFSALSFLAAAAVVRARSSSTWPSDAASATASSGASSLIPTGISSTCSSFLTDLNSNSTLTSCVSPIVSATSAFSPLSNSSANASAVTSALGFLCASSSACSDAAIRGQLTSFYTACTSELTGSSPNTDVIRIYDVLYTITPLKQAVCAKDDSGNYCVTQIASTSGASASALVAVGNSKSAVSSAYELVQNNLWSYISSPLSKRDDSSAALIPNTTTFRSSNLPFLFLTASTPSSSLCVACTRSVLTAYINFEQDCPYALGIANSPMFGGQSDLYSAVTSTCGSNFMSGAVQAAGGLSNSLISGAAPRISAEGGLFTAAAAAVLGLVAVL